MKVPKLLPLSLRKTHMIAQLLSCIWPFVTLWTAACQPSLSFTISQSLLKFMSTEPVTLTISSSATVFSFCLESFPASGSFRLNWLFTSSGQNIESSASASVLPMNIQGWFPLRLTGLVFLMSKGLSRVFSSTTVGKHQLFGAQPSLLSRRRWWRTGKPGMQQSTGLRRIRNDWATEQ